MEILGTEKFNESIGIHPVTKRRLMGVRAPMYDTLDKAKANLMSGDVAFFDNESPCGVYVTLDDVERYRYDTMLNMRIDRGDIHAKGIFIINDNGNLSFFSLHSVYKEIPIIRLYRNDNPKQPFDTDYFLNPQTHGMRMVWEMKECEPMRIQDGANNRFKHSVTAANEGINIKPVTKKRMKGIPITDDKLRSRLKTGDIIIDNNKKPFIYVSCDNYGKFGEILFDKRLSNELDSVDFITEDDMKEGILLKCHDDGLYTYALLREYGSDFRYEKYGFESRLERIYRDPNIKFPITGDYMLNPPIKDEYLIWENKRN